MVFFWPVAGASIASPVPAGILPPGEASWSLQWVSMYPAGNSIVPFGQALFWPQVGSRSSKKVVDPPRTWNAQSSSAA